MQGVGKRIEPEVEKKEKFLPSMGKGTGLYTTKTNSPASELSVDWSEVTQTLVPA